MKLLEMNDRLRIVSQRWLDHLLKKNTDYCPGGEGFENAKLVSGITGISVPAILFVNMQKHWSAVGSFLQKGELETEDILDRLGDIASYCQMMAVWIEEERNMARCANPLCGHPYSDHVLITNPSKAITCAYDYPDAPKDEMPGADCGCLGYVAPGLLVREWGVKIKVSEELIEDGGESLGDA